MHTRKDYICGNVTHAEYYDQFVTPAVRRLVADRIGVERIKASKDRNFNDIPLEKWDALHSSIMALAPRDKTDVCWNALGVSVCIAKQAAAQIRDEE